MDINERQKYEWLRKVVESDSSELLEQIQDAGAAAMVYGIAWGCVALSLVACAALGGF